MAKCAIPESYWAVNAWKNKKNIDVKPASIVVVRAGCPNCVVNKFLALDVFKLKGKKAKHGLLLNQFPEHVTTLDPEWMNRILTPDELEALQAKITRRCN